MLSFTTGQFQGIPLNSYYPETQQFDNYVPPEFEGFMENTVKDWVQLGMLLKWEDVSKSGHYYIPVVVSPWEWGPRSHGLYVMADLLMNSAGTLLLLWIMLQGWLR